MATHTVLFARGILARLALWPALRLAVHASWGGPASAEKQRWLAGILVDQFEAWLDPPTAVIVTREPPPDVIYVEELLLQVMADEFDVELEDDSAVAVARDILTLFETVRTGDETFVNALEVQAERVKGKVPQYERDGSEDDSESGSEWEDDGEQESDPVPQLLDHERQTTHVDEDGFTIVKRRGR